MSQPAMTANEQFQCLNTLEMLSDLFTVAGKDTFTREEILIVLNSIKHDEEIFDPDVVIAQEIAAQEEDAEDE